MAIFGPTAPTAGSCSPERLGRRGRRAGSKIAAALALWLGVAWAGAAAAQTEAVTAFAPATADGVADVAAWVITSGDNRGLPFAIVDKAMADVWVFGADGRLKGVTPALLGFAFGDHSTPGVGDREKLADIPPEDRTTPAGRFVAGYGPATGGKTVLWVDYATAVSIHPLLKGDRSEQRPERLASATPVDNRITYGCINVAPAFYKKVIRPTFKEAGGVFYVLPEIVPLQQALPAYRPQPWSRLAHRGDIAGERGGVEVLGGRR